MELALKEGRIRTQSRESGTHPRKLSMWYLVNTHSSRQSSVSCFELGTRWRDPIGGFRLWSDTQMGRVYPTVLE